MIMHAADRVRDHSWAVVLAGGGGSRLRGRTVDQSGHHVPKQYCVIDGEHTLLQLAITRARNLVDPSHILVVVLSQHRKWWRPQLEETLSVQNVVPQPVARGTAVGLLLPLLHVLARDPEAHVVVLPADHHFRNEERLARAIRHALDHTFEAPDTIVFIGIDPEFPASDFGYLVPQAAERVDLRPIQSFVEKPSLEQAEQLVLKGALWNTLIFAARGRRVQSLIRKQFPQAADALRGAMVLAEDPTSMSRALKGVYSHLASIDLSKDVLECSDGPMAVQLATRVGWSELGTPERVAALHYELQMGDSSGPLELHPPWEASEIGRDARAGYRGDAGLRK